MLNLFAFRLPRFVTNNPYVQVAIIIAVFVGQFFAFYDLYKNVRLKKWGKLSNTDKLLKVLDSLFCSLAFIFFYGLIYVTQSFFLLVPAMVWIFFVVPRVNEQVKRIDGFLASDDSPNQSLDSDSEEFYN